MGKECFLAGYGACSPGISKEHYISKAVLEVIGDGGAMHVGGLPWQAEKDRLQSFTPTVLTAKILCEKHNNGLSPLDAAAATLIRALNEVDKNPGALPAVTHVNGPNVERWMLKVLCGLAAIRAVSQVPATWKDILVGGVWPVGWGLYIPHPSTPQVLAKEFAVDTFLKTGTKEVGAAQFRMAGVPFWLLFVKPEVSAAWGMYRPRGIVIHTDVGERRVELIWPHKTEAALVLTKVGSTSVKPPQWEGWKE